MNAIKTLLSMGLPMAASRFIHTFNTFIVMLLLAQLGHDVLAASFSIAIIRIVALVIFMSPLFAIGAIVGREFAKQNLDGKHSASFLFQAWGTALLLAVIPMAALLGLKPLLLFFKQPSQLVPIIDRYFIYYLWAIPAMYLSTANQQFLAGIKQQKWVVYINLFSLALSVLLNYSLITGSFHLPKLGVAGAGLASIISACCSLLICTLVLLKLARLQFTGLLCKSFVWGKLILKIGTPIGVRTASDLMLMFTIMIITGWLGPNAMSAGQISNEYLMLALLPLFGLSEACAIITGHMLAEKQIHALIGLNRAALVLSSAFTLGIAGIFIVFHKQLANAFIDFSHADALAIYHLALWLLALRTIKMLVNGPIMMLSGLLKGLYDTLYPMYMNIITGWGLTLPLAYLFAFYFKQGAIGIVIAALISELILLVILVARWKVKLSELRADAGY